ncbi:MAG: DUF4976 domain-containing protein [Acidobacteria bacterium]|nr:DUF4976 domain-containing protein [Acidobacteriota bacterium]
MLRRRFLTGLAGAQLRPPNILLLIADDQRPDTIHALGNRVIRTPNLDRLVREGTAFTRGTCAYPVCVASRAELITGANVFRNGFAASQRLKEGVALMPDTLRRHGYETCYSGKWHHDGRPRAKGYATEVGFYTGAGGRFAKPQKDWTGRDVTGYVGWVFEEGGKPRPELGAGLTPSISEHIADAACEFIGRRRDQPFFLQVAFTAPHDPLLFPPGFERMYEASKMPLPPNFAAEHPFDHGNARGRDELLMTFPRTAEEVRGELACYYAVISHLDQQIGRILEALRTAALDSNTLVVFTSDNGLAIGSHGLRGKQNMYEHSFGVPFLMRGPGVARGLRTAAQCYLRDLFPTFCDYAGITVPGTVDGKSLRPVLSGKAKSVRQEAYGYFTDTQRMIRTDRWKFAWYPKAGREQLFDLRKDPHELRDRVADPTLESVKSELRDRLMNWLREQGDPLVAKKA